MYGIGLSKGIGIENIRIHGKRHTLFKTDDNRLRMVDGTCPHRGAKLADGRVKGKNIQCPYHGWEFGGDGKLKKVPSSESLCCVCRTLVYLVKQFTVINDEALV